MEYAVDRRLCDFPGKVTANCNITNIQRVENALDKHHKAMLRQSFVWKFHQKPKQSAVPLHHHHGGLHEAFHTLQSHVSSFFQKPKNLFVNCCPTAQALYAFKKELYPEQLVYDTRMNLRDLKHNGTIKDYVVEFTTLMLQIPRLSDDDLLKLAYELQHWAKQEFNFFNRNGRNNLAMSDEEIVKKFCKVPVYNIKFSDEEVAQMASHIDKRKSILVYFLSKADAMAYAKHGLIVSVPFPYVYSEELEIVMDYNMTVGPLRLIPEASEVKNALQVRKKAGLPHEYFSGVPVFESKNLNICQDYLRLTNEGFLNQRRPVFFKKFTTYVDTWNKLSGMSGFREAQGQALMRCHYCFIDGANRWPSSSINRRGWGHLALLP
ncbi:Uncharacterized protein Adt_45884 [Abeliophyllum distichum]|uniref:Retrotransposon gag domain-containing protein n=1 Tax=Abeliophyllum distichum TaxID=126358 RepID=A0ABD1P3R6_9LAMI